MIIVADDEKEILEKFKGKIGEDFDLTKNEFKDVHLIRFLRARDMDLKKTEEMFRESQAWRKDNNIEEILNWTPKPEHMNMMKLEYLGKDKNNDPAFYAPFKNFDFRLFANPEDKEELLKFFAFCNEKTFKWLKDYEHECKKGEFPQLFCVYDYKGIEFLKELMNMKSMELMKQNNKNYELNYPEVLSNVMLLNVPKVFYVVFELFKPFMPKKTLEKFCILDSSPPRWRTALLKKVPADVLPKKYGGLRTSPTRDFMSGNEIPYYEDDEEESLGSHGKLTELLIDARDSLTIELTIHKANSTLSIIFRTDDYDVGFEIENEKGEKVYPYKKQGSNVEPVTESIICKETGKYFLTFDNTFSRLRSKSLYYYISISDSEEDSEKVANGKSEMIKN